MAVFVLFVTSQDNNYTLAGQMSKLFASCIILPIILIITVWDTNSPSLISFWPSSIQCLHVWTSDSLIDSWFEPYWQAVAVERGTCLRTWPCHYASHQSFGWQMEGLEDKTASVGGTKVKRRITTLLGVRKSEAVIINGGFLPWEFIIVFDCSLLGLHNMQFGCPDCSLRASLVSDFKIPWL